MKYEELVKALRYCGKKYFTGDECKNCILFGTGPLCSDKLKLDAAAAIEALQADVQSYKALADEWKASAENKERLLGLYRAEQAKRFYSAMDNNGRVIQNPCACMNIPVFPDSSESPNS